MDAESSHILADVWQEVRTELTSVFTAFEQTTGLRVCFKAMSDRWRDDDGQAIVGAPFHSHDRSPFCLAVKRTSKAACLKWDITDLPAACWSPQGRVAEPFIRTCHAGADEILVPLWSDGVLVGLVMVGQFTRDNDVSEPAPLPRLAQMDTERVKTMTLPLRSYLLAALHRLDDERREPPSGRHGAIYAYIRQSLSTGPTLPGLAERLSLSRSRASHVVRELTGRSFQELVDAHRIAVAKDLLASSDATIAWVAGQLGFKDPSYFCRYFRQQVGMTPATFRRRHRRVISI